MGDWRRVTRHNPCPICGRSSWCAASSNGELCLCMRQASDWPAIGGMGGHFHRLTPDASVAVRQKVPARHTIFDPRLRGTISDWILSQLTLQQRHLDHLRGAQRRLNDEQVARRRYRTWPGREERIGLAERAATEFGALIREYPGFYTGRDDRAAFAGPDGLLLPVSDAQANVIGFQIRPNDPTLGKRVWLSSSVRRDGTGSAAPAHVSFPKHVSDPVTAYVVEGVLNADISSDLIGALCIGIAGKTNWRALDRRELSRGLIENVVVALDEDGDYDESNRHAIGEFLATSFRVRCARWDAPRAKGFDDLLNARGWFEII